MSPHHPRPRSARRGWSVVAAAALVLSTGCSGGAAPSPGASAAASASASPSAEVVASASAGPRRTTPPAIALSNFQGQVRGSQAALERRPADLPSRSRHVGFLIERAQILGTPADLVQATKLAAEAKSELPHEQVMLHLLRSTTFSAVHRFEPALVELAAVPQKPEHVPTEVLRGRAAIFAARGQLAEGLELTQRVRAAHPEIGILTLEGKILGQMGQLDVAARAFGAGEASYKNPAPFALADLNFERGLLAERNGDLTAAKAAYQEALERLPQHAHSALHLANLVPPKEGIALLEALGRTSQDPEVRGRLGALRELDAKGSGEEDVKAASAAYDVLLAELPEAYADHAAWFYLGAGKDADKAWTWASKNLEVRPNADAYELAIAAAQRAKRPDAERCAIVGRAKAYAWPSPMLKEAIASASCE